MKLHVLWKVKKNLLTSYIKYNFAHHFEFFKSPTTIRHKKYSIPDNFLDWSEYKNRTLPLKKKHSRILGMSLSRVGFINIEGGNQTVMQWYK